MTNFPFRALFLCIFLPPVCYILTLQTLEGYLQKRESSGLHQVLVRNYAALYEGRYSLREEIARNLEKVYTYFPRLKTRRTSQAAYTSGGEQQMCAIGRALMTNPSVVLLDEPSMGLAPQIVEEVFEIVKDLNTKEKVTFLIAEQNTNMALKYADYGYIMESGRIVMDGAADDLRNNEDVKEFYLGVGGGERKSFRDVKSYKRRKRWLA
jgi:branched-chain amino acid transport system ATP-binding protein